MKIIKEGKIPIPRKKYKKECSNCRTIFEFILADIQNKPSDKYSLGIYQIICPLCHEILYFDVCFDNME